MSISMFRPSRVAFKFQIAAILGRLDDTIDSTSVSQFVVSLQNSDGSFGGDVWGEVDNRFSFCAAATLSLLGRLDDMNVEK